MKDIKIIVATHKTFQMPKDNHLYYPIQVGSWNKEDLGYLKDDSGDNISSMNPYFCELTGLYWANKNLDADYIGLVHYRRYFTNQSKKFNEKLSVDDIAIKQEELEVLLKDVDILVPKRQKYYIETLYSHYAHTFTNLHLDETRKIIEKMYPDYLSTYDKVMKQTSGFMFNMYIMKKELSQAYCDWLFPILNQLYNTLDISEYTDFEKRLFGRVSELLFNVWLAYHQYAYKEIPYLYLEKINWRKKIISFLQAKFMGKKYSKSF